jgi:hypothetical protein
MNLRLILLLSALAISSIAAISFSNMSTAQMDVRGLSYHGENATAIAEGDHDETHVVRDSVFADLSTKEIPASDFMHFYDTTPYKIMNGHIAAKLPCDEQSETPIQILIGQAPNMTAAELENIAELSTPGQLCLYHADLHSPHGNHTGTADGRSITDIAIMNPTNADITLPNTSTLVIGINEIMPLAEGEHQHTEDGASESQNEVGHD